MERLDELIEEARRQNYDCSDPEQAHDRIDALAEAVAIIAAKLGNQHA